MTGSVATVDRLVAVTLASWRTISIVLVAFGAGAVGLSYAFAPRYRAEAIVAPQSDRGENAGALSSLSGELGGLASMIGLDAAGGTSKFEAIALLRASSTAQRLIETSNLLPAIFADRWDSAQHRWRDGARVPTLADGARRLVTEVFSITEDRRTGLVAVSATWTNPEEAAAWATQLVATVNQVMRASATAEAEKTLAYLNREISDTQTVEMRNVLFHLVEIQERRRLIAVVREDYALKTVDPASAPDKRFPVSPKRALYGVLGLLVGLVVVAGVLLFRAGSATAYSIAGRKGTKAV